VSLPCKDDARRWTVFKRLYEAVARGDWNGCIPAAVDLQQILPKGTYLELSYRYDCGRLKAISEGAQGNDDRVGLLVYELARARLAEATYVPGQLDSVRGVTLTSVEELRKHGFSTLATDLESQLRGASERALAGVQPQAPPSPGESSARSQGTGFVVTANGLILTALHVVDGANTITVRCPNRSLTPATVTEASRNNDLALLTTSLGGLTYLSFADARTLHAGDAVFTIGFPAPDFLGPEPKFTDGSVSAVSGPGGEASFLQVTVPVQPGNSGGPLLDKTGRVVGVVTASAAIGPFLKTTGTLPQNVNWAVKGDYAKALFNPPVPVPAAKDKSEAIERAKRVTCLIEASR